MMWALAGGVSACMTGALLYLSSPNQKMLPGPVKGGWLLGLLFFSASLACLWMIVGRVAGIFIASTALMLVLTSLPFAATFILPRKGA